MQIQRIQYNNSNNVNFGANLKITGIIDDISLKQLKTWKTKAQSIGCETDIIELELGKPINIDINKQLPKPINPRFAESWKRRVWRLFGVYPANSDLFISKREIKASTSFTDNNPENIGYFCDYYTKVENINTLKKWHIKSTNACVNEYLCRLKRN